MSYAECLKIDGTHQSATNKTFQTLKYFIEAKVITITINKFEFSSSHAPNKQTKNLLKHMFCLALSLQKYISSKGINHPNIFWNDVIFLGKTVYSLAMGDPYAMDIILKKIQ